MSLKAVAARFVCTDLCCIVLGCLCGVCRREYVKYLNTFDSFCKFFTRTYRVAVSHLLVELRRNLFERYLLLIQKYMFGYNSMYNEYWYVDDV